MADPTLPDDPNTQAYKSDFLAGKFAQPSTVNTPTSFGSSVTPEEDAGRTARTQAIATAQGHPAYVLGGSQEFLEDDSPLSRENSIRDRQFESRFGSGAIQPHLNAANAAEDYHALTARHTRLLNHAHARAESADYLHQSGQLDPTSETALEEHINNKTLFPGAIGDDVDASDLHFATIYNQHQRATGQGWNTIQQDIKSGYLTNDQIKRLPDGSIDYYTTHMLANEQGGAQAQRKQENAPEQQLERAYKGLDVLSKEGIKPDKDTDPEGYRAWSAHVKFLNNEIASAQARLTATRAKEPATPAAPKGPSPEFQASEARFKTPKQVESLPKAATVQPMKNAAITNTNQFFSR